MVATVGAIGTATAEAEVFHGYWIGGKIEQTYHRLGGWEAFGDATTPERVAARNGRFQVFQRDASIYWHPNVDYGTAHQVGGAFGTNGVISGGKATRWATLSLMR